LWFLLEIQISKRRIAASRTVSLLEPERQGQKRDRSMRKYNSPVEDYLCALYNTVKSNTAGKLADYIPELSKANPDWLGIALVTADGHVYEVGDSRQTFTIQSISKPFVYGLALEDLTRKEVLMKVGVEPSGEAFNSISLDPVSGRPRNPMINAGAIATTGLIQGGNDTHKFERILHMFELYAGRNLTVDEAVYASESATGHRNRAIGHMLRNFDILEGDPNPVLERYFRQCSINVSCRDLAVMGATLANGGVNPLTGERAIRGEYVESVLGIMCSCGMYDFAGEWIYSVGMPAKSGVAGGIVAVLPGQLGIGLFSPRLDEHGNSVRGIQCCNALSMSFNLHLFNVVQSPVAIVRLEYDGSEVSSNRQRGSNELSVLREKGKSIRVYELQGELVFATAEVIVRRITESAGHIQFAIIDLKRVLQIDEAACRLLSQIARKMQETGRILVFSHVRPHRALRRSIHRHLPIPDVDSIFFEDTNLALEYCEGEILSEVTDSNFAPIGSVELLHGMEQHEIDLIESLTTERRFKSCERIVRAGDIAASLFILLSGRVSVMLPRENGREKRLACFSAGMIFGEMAFIDGAPRSAMVYADEDVLVRELTINAFEQIGREHPQLKIRMLENLMRVVSRNLRKANREISILNQ
jgi:glutaminase